MFKKYTSLTLIALVTGLMLVSPVMAQSPEVTPFNQIQGNAQKCARLQQKIANHLRFYKNHRDNYQHRYEQIKNRIAKLVSIFKKYGLDTSQLEADALTLESKIQKFAADANNFFQKLEEANDFVCGQSEGEFKQKLQEAKELLKLVQADRKDIKEYINNTVKPEIKELRSQLPKKSPVPSASVEAIDIE